jgi:hypothetical protein
MNNQLLFFLRKLLLILVLLISADLLLGNLLETLYLRMNPLSSYGKTTYAIERANADLFVFGSSRASHHYVPEYFEKAFDKTFYNLGQDGQNIFYHYAILQAVQKRSSKPRSIILDFSPYEFSTTQLDYDRLSVLLPYYQRNEEIRSVVNLRGQFEHLKAYSNLYRYNSLAPNILIHNIMTIDEKHNKGYQPLLGEWKEEVKVDNTLEKIDDKAIEVFRSFIVEAKATGSNLYIVVSPLYKRFNKTQSMAIAESICLDNNVPFIDLSQDTTFLSSAKYFKDVGHLNNRGAEVFSKTISKNIAAIERLHIHEKRINSNRLISQNH